jgi:hypothetical protein
MSNKDATARAASEEGGEYSDFEPDSLLRLAVLTRENPTAASVFLTLLAKIGDEYALVVSVATLAKLCTLTVPDVERAIADLEDQDWIGRVIISSNPASSVAYVIRSRVSMSGKSESGFAHFQARILLSGEDNEVLNNNTVIC